MFEQTFVQPQTAARKPWIVAVSLSLQCLAVAILLLLPLLHTETLRLPQPQPTHILRVLLSQPQSPHPASDRRAAVAPPTAAPRPVFVLPDARVSPRRSIEVPSADAGPATGAGSPIEMFGGSPGPLPGASVLPPRIVPQPQPVARPAITGPLKVGGEIEGARLIYGPHPAYPAIAKAARSQGVVKLEAIIGADGAIRNLHVLSGPSLLVDAAREAVRQWRYEPTLLNGVAVEVLTQIDVNFTLSQ